MLANNSLDKHFISFINRAKKDFGVSGGRNEISTISEKSFEPRGPFSPTLCEVKTTINY